MKKHKDSNESVHRGILQKNLYKNTLIRKSCQGERSLKGNKDTPPLLTKTANNALVAPPKIKMAVIRTWLDFMLW